VPERARLIKRVTSDELRQDEVVTLREMFGVAWGDGEDRFTDEDWEHALGGVHVVLEVDGDIAAHASVVERELHTNGLDLTGYVEAVATRPSLQRRGYGSAVMREVGEYIDWTFRLGALGTSRGAFYERLGWVAWKGSDVRPHGCRSRADPRGGRPGVRPSDADVRGARPVGTDQLRLAAR